jgi:hypothetical protein
MLRRNLKGLALGVVLLSGCQDLDIVNVNDPDRFRALGDPAAMQSLVAGAFDDWFSAQHATTRANLFMNYATEMTSTTNAAGFFTEGIEPRIAHGNLVNIPAGVGVSGPRDHWEDMLGVASIANDLLKETDPTAAEPFRIIISGVDQTMRARAFAKFLQGISWGVLANMFDQVMVHTELDSIPTLSTDAAQFIVSSDEALEAAIAALEEAKTIATANNVTFPCRGCTGGGLNQWFFHPDTTALTTAKFVEMANTFAARFIVLQARTPAERAAVDWARVLTYTNAGLTTDFNIQLEPDQTSPLYQNAQDEVTGCTNCYRWDNQLIGHADISGNYQNWLAQPLGSRVSFNITSPDRRIVGATSTSRGSYTRHTPGSGCCLSSRPAYFRSNYQWRRHAHELGLTANRDHGNNAGVAHIATADENRLYAAEAYFHQGNLPMARDLINVTRTRTRVFHDGSTAAGLPAATVEGAPHSTPTSNDCVPRTDANQCGDLHVALWYERMVENAGLDAVRGYLDSRAFGLMLQDSYIELPLPANELDQMELALYTFGGAGGQSSAVYAPVGAGWDGVP